jgi:hypothetical protein
MYYASLTQNMNGDISGSILVDGQLMQVSYRSAAAGGDGEIYVNGQALTAETSSDFEWSLQVLSDRVPASHALEALYQTVIAKFGETQIEEMPAGDSYEP